VWRLYEFFKDPSIEPEGGEDVLFECDDGGPRELTPSYLELLKEFAAISATRLTDDDLLSAIVLPWARTRRLVAGTTVCAGEARFPVSSGRWRARALPRRRAVHRRQHSPLHRGDTGGGDPGRSYLPVGQSCRASGPCVAIF